MSAASPSVLTSWRQAMNLGFSRREELTAADLNPFSPKFASAAGRFDCNLLTRLQGKRYFRRVLLDRYVPDVNVLAIASDNLTDYLSERCTVSHRRLSARVVQEELQCGETRLLNAAFDGSPLAREELRLRCEGRVPFAAEEVAEASWWRRLLFRQRLQAGAADGRAKPHAVVVGPTVPQAEADWLEDLCRRQEIPIFHLRTGPQWMMEAMAKQVKRCVIRRVIEACPLSKAGYEAGYKSGQQFVETTLERRLEAAEAEGYAEGQRRAKAALDGQRSTARRDPQDWDGAPVPRESLLPEHFKCPITKEPLYDPAITKQGYTYERSAIEAYVREHQQDFVTGEPLRPEEVYPNRVIRPFLQWIRDNSSVADSDQPLVRVINKGRDAPFLGPISNTPKVT